MSDATDEGFMREAIALAREAAGNGEVPVGAILVRDGCVIGRGMSCQIQSNDPSAHAEVSALRDAGRRLGNYRIVDSTLYVTLEPCMMCVGSMVNARISELVYGCTAPKTGVVDSHGNLLDWTSHNHRIKIKSGVLAAECSALLTAFFDQRREGD